MNITPQEKVDFFLRTSTHAQNEQNIEAKLSKIIDEIIRFTAADQGYLFMVENEEIIPFIKRTRNGTDVEQKKVTLPTMILIQSFQANQIFFVQDAQTDERFKTLLSVSAFHLHSFLCIPVFVNDKKEGLLYLQQTETKEPFLRDHLESIKIVMPVIGLLLENMNLQKDALEKGRMQRELQMARDVQNGLIMKEAPHYQGWKTAIYWQPAFEVGGDFYDFIPISEHLVGLVIADVSDKGMPAALFMALTRTTMRAVAMSRKNVAEMITQANHLIYHDAHENMFVTLFFGLLNLENGELFYVNAGHNPPFLYDREHDTLMKLKPTGMAMGVDAQAKYEQKKTTLREGDFLFLYTDGALDAVVRNKVFDEKELHAFIRRHRNADPQMIVNMLKEKLYAVNSDPSYHDDLTIIAWKRDGKEKTG